MGWPRLFIHVINTHTHTHTHTHTEALTHSHIFYLCRKNHILYSLCNTFIFVFWSPDANSWLIGKDPYDRKDWRQKKKRMTGWDGWVGSLIQWTWIWANFRKWWWTRKPGVLQSMESGRDGHELATEQHIHLFSKPWESIKYQSYHLTMRILKWLWHSFSFKFHRCSPNMYLYYKLWE